MIVFKNVRYKNFLSAGNIPIEISLNTHPTTLSMGGNGTGKSTVLDAICFGLFGKPFRNVTKGKLVNSINRKECLVELELSIGNIDYIIRRGISPTVFEIYKNGELLNQDAASRDYQEYLETSILKINYKSFTQIVILGSATFKPFMQLPAASRREIIEDLLDIKVFSGMNVIAKERLASLKQEISKASNEIELKTQVLNNQKRYYESLKNSEKDKIDRLKLSIQESESKIEVLKKQKQDAENLIVELTNEIGDKKSIQSNLSDMKVLETKLKMRIKKLDDDILFYTNNDSCPTCKQPISNEYKKKSTESKIQKREEIYTALEKLKTEMSTLNNRMGDIEKIDSKISNIRQNNVMKFTSDINTEDRLIASWKKEISNIEGDSVNLKDEELKIVEMKSLVELEKVKYNELNEELQYLNLCIKLLKDDGIKTTIVNRYLPVINNTINKFLQEMDFFVQFELDEEFNESIKSRYRDDFIYESFSEGQKARINLAILFTWRVISKMRNSTNTNLLILDEVFDGSLDLEGTDFVMKYLADVSQHTNVFVISHKEQLIDKFSRMLKFSLVNNYSDMEIV